MSRPLKEGVDYFPLDVHFDNKLKFVKIKYGAKGIGVIILLLQHIYQQSYYCEWSEDEQMLFADEVKEDLDYITEVVNYAIKRKFFNKQLHDQHEILTSKGIQKRYKEIVRKRKNVEVAELYRLVGGIWGVNAGINKDSSGSNEVNDGESTQRKGKESKVKNSIVNKSIENYTKEEHLGDIDKDIENYNNKN